MQWNIAGDVWENEVTIPVAISILRNSGVRDTTCDPSNAVILANKGAYICSWRWKIGLPVTQLEKNLNVCSFNT